jgi:hypothetical protein
MVGESENHFGKPDRAAIFSNRLWISSVIHGIMMAHALFEVMPYGARKINMASQVFGNRALCGDASMRLPKFFYFRN